MEKKNWNDLSFYEKSKDILGFIGSLSFITLLVLNLLTFYKMGTSNNYSNEIVGMCMDKYQRFSSDLRNYNHNQTDSINTTNLMYQYIDLTNEELFYIRNKVVSPDVSRDWMTGMIKQMKIFKKEKEYETIKSEYPRIVKTFDIDIDQVNGGVSKQVIDKCLNNLMEYNSNQ